ncbi:unnamed protein product [Cylicocyclus nassatus]|uniref:DH domain-containing protein n=1 Tax=Cylicocyclus nassatus TaxID=53992 RepID=A0AA36GU45_CYLNA|nr:unnamed protein product [Cylicocyclus nassatus]
MNPSLIFVVSFGILIGFLLFLFATQEHIQKFLPVVLKQVKINCTSFLNEIDPPYPAILIDTDILEAIKEDNCSVVPRKIRVGVDIGYADAVKHVISSRYDTVLFENSMEKDYLRFFDRDIRIIPREPLILHNNFAIPTDIEHFLEYWKRSKLIECINMKVERDSSARYLPKDKTLRMMSTLMRYLVSFHIYPFLNGGTLLGWFRECDIIPHTMDIDFAAFVDEYKPEVLEHLQKNQTTFYLTRKFGKPNDSYEFTLRPRDRSLPIMDLFWMYSSGNESWVGGSSSDGGKFKYTYPRISDICAGDLFGHIFWVPCNSESIVVTEYGPEWYKDHPTANFSWFSSHYNVKKNGKWSAKELEQFLFPKIPVSCGHNLKEIQEMYVTRTLCQPYAKNVCKNYTSVIGTRIDENGDIKADDQFLETVLAEGATDEKFQICQELYSTERHYINNLKLLLKLEDVLLEKIDKDKVNVDKTRIKHIFGKIQPIVDLHEKICHELADLIENWNDEKCDVAKIWINANSELLRIYPTYLNFCDEARKDLIDACEQYPRLRALVKEQEKSPEFRRQRAVDIMTFPVQRLAGVKLLLEKLHKKSSGKEVELKNAIETVGNVLKHSNNVKLENDVLISQLRLLQEVEGIPSEIVYASHVLVYAVEVQFICATNRKKLSSRDSVLRLTLFSDGVVLVCNCSYRKIPNWITRTRATTTLCKMWKKPYKFLTTLKVDQFRSIMFVHCLKRKENTCALERSPVCCLKIREKLSDNEWFVAVENPIEMDQFAGALERMIMKKMTRSLSLHMEMSFWEVPSECKSTVRKVLEAGKFIISEEDDWYDRSRLTKGSKESAQTSSSHKSSIKSFFDTLKGRRKNKERLGSNKFNRRHTLEPRQIQFSPIREET